MPLVRRLARALRPRRPTQAVALGFALLILVGTLLLALPAARAGPGSAPLGTALFTSTSAATLTGLATVDTAAYWSGFGDAVLLGLAQVGGFGIMASASLIVLALARRVGLQGRLAAQLETGASAADLGSLRRVLLGVAVLTVVFEAATALAVGLRLWLGYGEPAGEAARLGMFHAVSAFNNAGFAVFPEGLAAFATDGAILVPLALAALAGGLGFPVWLELVRRRGERRRRRRLSLHSRLTLVASGVLVAVGTLAVLALEWENPRTLGGLGVAGKLLGAFFAGVMPRGAGFSTLDYGAVDPGTLLVTDALMFIGGGSASTAGGIKVTTFALLVLVVWSELRSRPDVTAFGRRVPPAALRQAFALTAVALGIVLLATLALTIGSDVELSDALFEALSAFGTVGLSTGITAELSGFGQAVLMALMFIGRVGPLTLGIALLLREREPRYRLPEERPLVG